MIKKKGFTLLEVSIVLGIGTLIAFMKFQDMRNNQESVLADNVGTQIKQLGEAVNRYISI
ncbi:prepilin-type N-terminal cleavage/methylation domain-containing protein, partial [Escherichia coli]|nr:prepilin-type N-terminal cleavage/methylation domain-containing protein [Escherichia coli]